MSYIDQIETAALKLAHPSLTSVFDLDVTERMLDLDWKIFEELAREEHYDVLRGSHRLRQSANNVAKWLYTVYPQSHLEGYVRFDLDMLRKKDTEYGGSWQRRGGPGAFFTACRKWDRYIQSIARYGTLKIALETDKRDEGIVDDIGDLRRYLILWEAWRIANLDLRPRQ